MTDFLNRIRHDRDLAARLAVAVGAKDGAAALDALVAFAVLNGFDVTGEDAETVRERFQGVRAQEGELADAELDAVAGGNIHDPLGWRATPSRRHGMGKFFGLQR
ncbi:hypothetical protein [Hyphomicrobium nitrativorans]|nr:hypothetical protein [Hyphomicrobium nitrativorans]